MAMADLKWHFDSSQTPEARNFAPFSLLDKFNMADLKGHSCMRKSGDMILDEVPLI